MTSAPEYLRLLGDPARTALLMWDFQVGLAGRSCHREEVVASAERLLATADRVGVPVFWSRHTLPPPQEAPLGMRYFQMRKQGVLSVGDLRPFMLEASPERAFLPELGPREHDTVVAKGTPSFFVGTRLDELLRDAGVETVVVAGVALEIGVDLTAKHALTLGYLPIVVEDAVGSYTDERRDTGLAAMRSWIPVVRTDDVVEHLEGDRQGASRA